MSDTYSAGRARSTTFETTYECRNCGNEWTEQHPPRTVVDKSVGVGAVLVKIKDCDEFATSDCGCCYTVRCTVCELLKEVRVVDRAPVSDTEGTDNDDDDGLRTDGGGGSDDSIPGPPYSPIAAERGSEVVCQFNECENGAEYRLAVKQFTLPLNVCQNCADLHLDRGIDRSLLSRSVDRKLRSLRTDRNLTEVDEQ